MTDSVCPVAERVWDALLRRYDAHFADPAVRAELLAQLDVHPAVLTAVIQHVAARLFPEAFDEPGLGLVGRHGPERVGPSRLEAFAARIGA